MRIRLDMNYFNVAPSSARRPIPDIQFTSAERLEYLRKDRIGRLTYVLAKISEASDEWAARAYKIEFFESEAERLYEAVELREMCRAIRPTLEKLARKIMRLEDEKERREQARFDYFAEKARKKREKSAAPPCKV